MACLPNGVAHIGPLTAVGVCIKPQISLQYPERVLLQFCFRSLM